MFKTLSLGLAVSIFALSYSWNLSFAQEGEIQECKESQFRSKTGEKYLEVTNIYFGTTEEEEEEATEEEGAVVEEKEETPEEKRARLAATRTVLDQMLEGRLNCYETNAVRRLSAAVHIESDDFPGAAYDLVVALNSGATKEPDEILTTYKNIWQIYLSTQDYVNSLKYIKGWLANGAAPNREETWQIAYINHQAAENAAAAEWAEKVLAIDELANEPKREVYDFLLYLYGQDLLNKRPRRLELLERMLWLYPNDKVIWNVLSSEYFTANEDRKAFEVQKAMYQAGLLTEEQDLLRLVNFYNSYNAPFHAAKVLEKELNADRISRTLENFELLANLYQVAREHKRAVPAIAIAAKEFKSGKMYERLGRSYSEIHNWKETKSAFENALKHGKLGDLKLALVLLGQARYELGDLDGAERAFSQARSKGGRDWLSFLKNVRLIRIETKRLELNQVAIETDSEDKNCRLLRVLGKLPAGCNDVAERLEKAQKAYLDYEKKFPRPKKDQEES